MATQQKTKLSQLNIIHMALVAGIIIFLSVFYYLISNGAENEPATELKEIFQLIVIMLGGFSLIGGNFMYKRKLNSILTDSPLEDKIALFGQASIVRYAMIEGPALFCGVAFFLIQDISFLIVGALLAVYMLTLRPTKGRVIQDLRLSPEETELLENDTQNRY